MQGLGALVGFWLLTEATRRWRLAWALLRDRRVPLALRTLPILAVLYALSPIDLLPDRLLGLGQLDDLLALFLALEALVRLAPRHLVRDHLGRTGAGRATAGRGSPAAKVVDSTGHVVEDGAGVPRSERRGS
ncbi:MAG: DUF1232 domain-containing protein [Chloroflexi bacterium]|nr:DUF1232 domain-containing protein [Chloroflexota bacterium]